MKPVNVATVAKLSPFRYPGGKTWIVPRVREWLRRKPREFFEPFAGGGIVSLTVAREGLASHVTMTERDEQVAAVWKTLIENAEGDWLARRIVKFDLTLESLEEALSRKPRSTREQAFQTILKNRTHRGGILAPGSAPLRLGENGRGIKSRWYPETLKKRILDIHALRHRITFIEGDGIELIRQNRRRKGAAFFVDPPYTVAGKRAGSRLYKHSEIDHHRLFKIMAGVSGDFLMTYDDSPEVRELARTYNFDTRLVSMKNTHHREMTELMVGRDLGWVR